MGFYLRKAFRMGPVRVNLSKHGLGVSAGPRGARLGATSNGRIYTHMGRGGLYHRRYLRSRGGEKGGRPGPEEEVKYTGPIELEEDTGATYAPEKLEPERIPLKDTLEREPVGLSKTLLFPGAASVLYILSESTADVSTFATHSLQFLALLFIAAWPIKGARIILANKRGREFGALLSRYARLRRPLSGGEKKPVMEALLDRRITDKDKRYFSAVSYLSALRAVIEDRKVSDQELSFLRQFEEILKLDKDFIRDARVELFREAYLEAAADMELTEEEERLLDHLKKRLDIPEDEVEQEMEIVQRLKELREIRSGKLESIDSGIQLKRNEVCYAKSPARLLKSRILQSFQREGRRIKIRGFIVEKEGELLVTNKRLVLVHKGVSTIPLNRIIDVEVDYDHNLLTIVRDGARNPTYITTPDAMRVGAVMDALSST